VEEKGSEVLAYKKAIEGLKKAAEELARYAPMKVNGRCQMYFDCAIYLLKEQEAVKPAPGMLCGQCGCRIYRDANYCYNCGKEVKWDAAD
jgi:hypothetical protein